MEITNLRYDAVDMNNIILINYDICWYTILIFVYHSPTYTGSRQFHSLKKIKHILHDCEELH